MVSNSKPGNGRCLQFHIIKKKYSNTNVQKSVGVHNLAMADAGGFPSIKMIQTQNFKKMKGFKPTTQHFQSNVVFTFVYKKNANPQPSNSGLI